MRKKTIIVISILLGITLLLTIILFKKKSNNYKLYNNSGSQLSFFYQDDNGEYVPSTDSKWTDSTYVLNIEQSSCNGQRNPTFLSWDNDTHMVILSNGVSTSCNLYFDKKLPTIFDKCPGAMNLTECITQIDGGETGEENLTSDLCPEGIGTVYKHNGTIDVNDDQVADDAGDGGYRYSGCNPNNYICFGANSEAYNKGETNVCLPENKYRVIGYVPVEVNGKQEFRLKVIKAEYLTDDEFISATKDGTITFYPDIIKRVESLQTEIPVYKWSAVGVNMWQASSLHTALNSSDYINKAFGETWKSKIEEVTWNVGGASSNILTPQAMYQQETGTQGSLMTAEGESYLIGLMYAHDYGFASSSNNWQFTLFDYSNSGEGNNNRENNWLFNGVREWTISRRSSDNNRSFVVNATGSMFYDTLSTHFYAVRPVFYLTSDTNIFGDDTSNGSVSHPFKVEVPELPIKTPTFLDKCDSTGNLVECFENIGDENLDVGEGELLHHTSDLPDSAKDNGYRYAGNNPNNYICFGSGSEEYNKGTPGETCDVKNKYRIIGYVPVTLADGSSTSLIKVIKAEYLTEDEFGKFGTKAGTADTDSSYAGIKRIESPQSGIPAYQWDDSSNIWNESTIYTSLNSDDPKGYKNTAYGSWLDKIETVIWNVGGVGSSYDSYNAQKMYEEEMKGQGATTPVEAQIGLMYAHDYGFSSSSNNWQTELFNYSNAQNRDNNWLFNGVFEWTISRFSLGTGNALIVSYSGFVSLNGVSYTNRAVRPVFYLKSDVNILDSDANGSREKPFRIAI